MKNSFLFLLFLFPSVLLAQIPIGDLYSPEASHDSRLPDNIVFDFTYGMWLEAPTGVKPEFGWPGFNLYWMFDQRLGKDSKLSFAIGFGLGSDNIHTNARFVPEILPDGSTFVNIEPWQNGYEYRRNKMVLNYFDFPVEFRFKTTSRWRMHVGGKFGLLLNHHDKLVDSEGKYKNFNTPNLLPYRYGVHARLGRKRINVNAFYSLAPLFEDNGGTELNTVSVGLSLFLL